MCIYTYWRREWQSTLVILAWRISWAEEHSGLQSTGSQRIGHNWSKLAQHIYECVCVCVCVCIYVCMYMSIWRDMYNVLSRTYLHGVKRKLKLQSGVMWESMVVVEKKVWGRIDINNWDKVERILSNSQVEFGKNTQEKEYSVTVGWDHEKSCVFRDWQRAENEWASQM